MECWIQANMKEGREIPTVGETSSGKFITRIPKSLHVRLVSRAKQEGVSMNALVSVKCMTSRSTRFGNTLRPSGCVRGRPG